MKVVISVGHFITEGIFHQVIALISKKNGLHKKAQYKFKALRVLMGTAVFKRASLQIGSFSLIPFV